MRITVKAGSNVITREDGSLNVGRMLSIMALEALNTCKWIIEGNGQISP